MRKGLKECKRKEGDKNERGEKSWRGRGWRRVKGCSTERRACALDKPSKNKDTGRLTEMKQAARREDERRLGCFDYQFRGNTGTVGEK